MVILTLTAIALSLPAILVYTYTSKVSQEMKAISYLDVENRARYVEVEAVAVVSRNTVYVTVKNRGGKDLEIEGIYALSICDSRGVVLRFSGSREALRPGAYYYVSINLVNFYCSRISISSVYVVTSEPRVYSARIYNITMVSGLTPITEGPSALAPRAHVILPIEVRDSPWDIGSVLSNAGFVLADPDDSFSPSRLALLNGYGILWAGMRTASGRWVEQPPLITVDISMSNTEIRSVFLGYDPRDPSKYVLLITNDGGIAAMVGGTQRIFCSGYSAARLKVYGFRNTTKEGIIWIRGDVSRFGSGVWVVKPDQDVSKYAFVGGLSRGRISMAGRADRVEVYCFEIGDTRDTGYLPYLLSMNTVGEPSRTSILFTTIDAVYGNATTRNDSPGSVVLQDFSNRPLALVYRNLAISNNDAKAILLALNYRFYDNDSTESSNLGGVTIDRPIVILGIIDKECRVVFYRSFTFRELARYENTYPPATQAQSALTLIPLPSKEVAGVNSFYVFIIIQDPYLFSSSDNRLDDVDVVLYVDSLVLLLYE